MFIQIRNVGEEMQHTLTVWRRKKKQLNAWFAIMVFSVRPNKKKMFSVLFFSKNRKEEALFYFYFKMAAENGRSVRFSW